VPGWFRRKPGKDDAAPAAEDTAPYDVGEFSIKHGLSIYEARRILREAGQSREEADAAAATTKLRTLMSGGSKDSYARNSDSANNDES
jgi:hypothetical protein